MTLRRGFQSHPVLLASAAVLAGLILLQAGLPRSPLVQADMVAQGSGFTMLTFGGRRGALDTDVESIVLVDDHTGWMLVYELTGSRPNRRIDVLDGGSMARMFERNRPAATPGR
jgi:hypothetical protein